VTSTTVLGVDGCKGGWVGIVLDEDCRFVGALRAETITALVSLSDGPSVVAIDIPIELVSAGTRNADALARQRLGKLASSVFPAPITELLELGTYDLANAHSRTVAGKGLTRQTFALFEKIREVREWVATRPSATVVEVHPELSFARMNDSPLTWNKRSWAGQSARRRLVADAGIDLPHDLGQANAVPVDDVLDAAAAAWTAWRVAHGKAVSIPEDLPTQRAEDRGLIWL